MLLHVAMIPQRNHDVLIVSIPRNVKYQVPAPRQEGEGRKSLLHGHCRRSFVSCTRPAELANRPPADGLLLSANNYFLLSYKRR